MKYISIQLYRKVINHALSEGMKLDDFKNSSFPVDSIDNIQAVPADIFFELHEYIDKYLGPGFSVRVGQQMRLDDYGVLGLSWRTCSTADEIFKRCERYFFLLSNTYLFKVEEESEVSNIFLLRDAHRRGVELSNEATFSATVVVLKATTETEIAPVSVRFKHGPPRDIEDYEHAFRCPIQFNQPHNYISYKSTDLATRTAKADKKINQYLIERVEEETKGIEISSNKIASDVETLIKDALPSGIPSMSQLCEQLGMSSRTLIRRLSESDLTFRELIHNIQQNISKDLLRNSSNSIGEIAFQTGFSEQSAFNRAFKRWTGQSPSEFRKSN